jgi:hypothetical protein
MRKNLSELSIRLGVASACLCTMINSATAGSFTRGCAARDLLIEEREDTNTVSADKLSDAMLAMLDARIVCHTGHVMDAMAIYDRIAQSVTSDTFLSAREK